MAGISISTPKGTVIQTENGKAKLTWNSDFVAKRTEKFTQAQMYVDSEVLHLCSPLVPLDTGMLKESGTLGTTVGSGEVNYIAPYAAPQYYNTAQTRSYDRNRGGKWFERMKASNLDDIKKGAKKRM